MAAVTMTRSEQFAIDTLAGMLGLSSGNTLGMINAMRKALDLAPLLPAEER